MNPVLFRIGSVAIYSYAFFGVLALLSAMAWAYFAVIREGLPGAVFWNAPLAVCFFALLFGRAVHLLFNWSDYRDSWRALFLRWRPGLSFHGLLIGVLLGVWTAAHRSGIPLAVALDIVAPAAALGHAIGRASCFFNGCCLGKPTAAPWGVRFPNRALCPDDRTRHPTQIYESTGLFALFGITALPLLSWSYPGQKFVVFIAGYSLLRFFTDFLRDQMKHAFIYLTYSQWFSLFALAASAAYHLRPL
jgi:phosphatidylglycerol:prolipoprotein diacylglycerol transferase